MPNQLSEGSVRVELLPRGRVLQAERGASLQDLLFAEGVEFPCGGKGRCKGCRVRVLAGDLPVTEDDRRLLSADELASGWRLSCRGTAEADLRIELAQWEASILADDSEFGFEPQEGLGVAVDLGTTTIVAQLLDLRTGEVLGVVAEWNQQAKHGADIMSRVGFGSTASGLDTLCRLVRGQVGAMLQQLFREQGHRARELRRVVVVGNTVMHHLFGGISVEPLAHSPFEPAELGLLELPATAVGWEASAARVFFLPCLGGFVGSDILAGILATRLHEAEPWSALLDLGTNGEIVAGNRDGLLCASTAAGPAFEGAGIAMGMRAATGAISGVEIDGTGVKCHVLGHGAPRGLCGSGLVDAVACGLELGRIQPNGRMPAAPVWELAAPVTLSQADIRQLQLAKSAIAAGLRLLVQQRGGGLGDIRRGYLAGAFGNYINRRSARRIGLLELPLELVVPAGNTALLGAKRALCLPPEADLGFAALRAKVRHVGLHEDPSFHEAYVEGMGFPPATA